MITKKPMTESIRNEIKVRNKNRLDISDLIENVNIKNEHLTNCIIKRFNRVQEDISGTNFSNSIIGEENQITNLSGSNLSNCNFSSVKFLGKIWFRACDLRNTTFDYASIPGGEYQYADMRNVSLCDAVVCMGSRNWLKAKFEWKLWENLSKYMQVDLIK